LGYEGSSGYSGSITLKCSKCDAFCGTLTISIEARGYETPDIDDGMFKALPRPEPRILSCIAKDIGLPNIQALEAYIDATWFDTLKATLGETVQKISGIYNMPQEVVSEFKDFVREFTD